MNQTHPSIEQIVDYLHRELAPAQDAAMHAHLAACPVCEQLCAQELAITDALRAHARAEERELPAGVVARIRAAVERPRESASNRLRAAFRPIFVVPAVVAVAVVAYLGVDALHAAVTPTPIDAAYYVNNHAAMAATAPFGEDVEPAMLTSDETR